MTSFPELVFYLDFSFWMSLGTFPILISVYIRVFCAPEPIAQVHYCALSVVRPSSLTFHIFDFSSETAERNSTKLGRKQDLNVLYHVCVIRANRKKQDGRPCLWLVDIYFRLLLRNRWTEFNETWQKARPQHPLPSKCFSGRSEKQDGRNGLWSAETFSTSPLKPLNGINKTWQEARSQRPLQSLCFSGRSEKQDGRPATKLDRKRDLNVLYQVCVFRADWKKKMTVLASDWLRHFRLVLWNCSTEFNETWQGARSQRPLPSMCFSGRSEKQDGDPGQFFKKVAHCTQVTDMWPFGPLVYYGTESDRFRFFCCTNIKRFFESRQQFNYWPAKSSTVDRSRD